MSGSHSLSLLFVLSLAWMAGAVVRAWMREARTQFEVKPASPAPRTERSPVTPEDAAGFFDRLGSPNESEAKSAERRLDECFYGSGDQDSDAALRISPLFQLLVDTAKNDGANDAARGYALSRLGSLERPGARQILLDALQAKSARVRAAAAGAIWFLSDPTTVAPLVEVLQKDDSYEVRSSVTRALGWIRSPEAVPALMTCFEKGDKRAKVDSLWALGSICDPRSLPLARAALSHRYRRLREAAKMALAGYDDVRRKNAPPAPGYLP